MKKSKNVPFWQLTRTVAESVAIVGDVGSFNRAKIGKWNFLDFELKYGKGIMKGFDQKKGRTNR